MFVSPAWNEIIEAVSGEYGQIVNFLKKPLIAKAVWRVRRHKETTVVSAPCCRHHCGLYERAVNFFNVDGASYGGDSSISLAAAVVKKRVKRRPHNEDCAVDLI